MNAAKRQRSFKAGHDFRNGDSAASCDLGTVAYTIGKPNTLTVAVRDHDPVGRLHGRVVNSGPYPIATFEATDVAGLRAEFRRSIDDSLVSCEEDGVAPRKPFSGRLNVRLGQELHGHRARAAADSGMSLNGWIEQALPKSVSG